MRRSQKTVSRAPPSELDELRARLEEAEQTLEAIRSGSVDALVIAGPDGERVFTLEGEDYRYRRLVETMKEGAAILAEDGSVIYANERLAEMLGVSLTRLIGSNVEAYVEDALRPTFQALTREGVRSSSKAEVLFLRRGARVPTYVSATPTGDNDGGVCLVVTDLTEQKRSEEILVAERLATSILEQAAEAVVVCSPDGRIVRASRAAHRLARQNPLLRPFGAVFAIRLRDGGAHDELVARALAGEIVSGAEATLVGAHYGAKHLVVSAAPLMNAKQETIGCVVSLTDVTERKRAEDGMQLLGRASAALGGSLDIETMVQKLVGVVVPAFADWCTIYLLARDGQRWELAGAEDTDPERLAYARSELERADLRGTFANTVAWGDLPVRQNDLDGDDDAFFRLLETRSVMGAPIQANGRRFGVIFVGQRASTDAFRDESLVLLAELALRTAVAIDNSRLFDLARREKQRVEEANRAKDDFLAAVSHELRTPLNAILGWARMLRSRGLPDDKRDRALETIERNAVMQAQLVDDLLDISRIVSGKLRLDRRDVDIVLVVQAAIDAVRPLAQAKDVALEATFGPAAGSLLGDPSRLQQVVWNLLTNAVKFTNKGGHVRVSIRSTSAEVDIEVADDGRGISTEFLPHVFERFRQAEGGITRAQGGLGIGLTIVKDLIELHGGTITAHSDGEGRGARFAVTLPCTEPGVEGERRDAGGAPVRSDVFECSDELSGARLLVVDDDSDGREIVAEVLRECQADVRTADSARSAFSILQHEHFDALLSDISMPGEDGYSLIGRVRALPPEQNGRIPAVALTAFARAEDRRRALVAGFNGHIPKPVEPQKLVIVLSNMIRRPWAPHRHAPASTACASEAAVSCGDPARTSGRPH